MDQIAAEARVAKATLYRRFPTKSALADELARRGLAEAAPTEGRREQIVEAAARAFARGGVKGSTVEQIASEAGISPAAIYWYFSSKEELAAEVLREVGPTFLTQHLSEDELDDPPREALTRLALGLLERGRERGDLLRLLLFEAPNNPELAQVAFERAAAPNLANLTRYMQVQAERGRFRPGNPRARVVGFVGPLLSLLLFKRAFGERLPLEPETLVDELVDNFLRGVAADPEEE
jgi:AcrR family transcriptional regulator